MEQMIHFGEEPSVMVELAGFEPASISLFRTVLHV
jgi:hypothetical protein